MTVGIVERIEEEEHERKEWIGKEVIDRRG